MTLFLLSQIPWLAALYVVVRHHQSENAARLDAQVVEREEWAKERRELLNRIQAPEAARKQAEIEIPTVDLDNPPYVPWDNDEAFHEARGVEV